MSRAAGKRSAATRIGVLGGGQLGRMLALAAYPLGIRTTFLDPDASCPSSQIGPLIKAAYDDEAALRELARRTDAVTTEFENVPARAAEYLQSHAPFFPGAVALAAAQERLSEKMLFRSLGIPTAQFAAVESRAGLDRALEICGTPCVLKTRRLGYDGKGQFVIRSSDEASDAWGVLGKAPLILESFVAFERELSIIAVRGRDGATVFYPLVENHHADGILRLTLAPAARVSPALQQRAEDYCRAVLDRLGYVGVLTIEFFQRGEELLANEMACRVHNSGHWTIEGSVTSQFENHMRAVAGLPLGATRVRCPCAMVNLIGTTPLSEDVLAIPGACLHLYGKDPRPGRKLGHITIIAEDEPAMTRSLNQVWNLIESE